jgi:NAD(P)-dependent dehydrogenase (short-subunit alcohol dehydrogenase family)
VFSTKRPSGPLDVSWHVWGKPADLAGSTAVPLSDAAEWIVGQVRYIDGGVHLRQ